MLIPLAQVRRASRLELAAAALLDPQHGSALPFSFEVSGSDAITFIPLAAATFGVPLMQPSTVCSSNERAVRYILVGVALVGINISITITYAIFITKYLKNNNPHAGAYFLRAGALRTTRRRRAAFATTLRFFADFGFALVVVFALPLALALVFVFAFAFFRTVFALARGAGAAVGGAS